MGNLWKQVEKAQEQDLPKRVIALTEKICAKAQKEGTAGDLFKAFMLRKQYSEYLDPDSSTVELKRMKEWAEKAPVETDAALWHFLIARQYATIYNQNFYRLSDDDALLGGTPSDDVRTWSRNQLMEHVVAHVDSMWHYRAQLAVHSCDSYLPFVEQGKHSLWFAHSMSALLGRESVNLIGGLRGFVYSGLCVDKVKQIYTQLIEEMEQRGLNDGNALLELEYLQWRKQYDNGFAGGNGDKPSTAKEKAESYRTQLQQLLERFGDSPVSVEMYVALAREALQHGEPSLAMEYCDEALSRHPNYSRIGVARQLKSDLLYPILYGRVGQTAYPGKPVELRITYKNLDGFSLVMRKNGKLVEKVDFALPQNNDYREHDTVVNFVAPEVGTYEWELVSNHPWQISQKAEVMEVSRIKLLANVLADRGVLVKTLDAQSGRPLGDVKVDMLSREERLLASYRSDEGGTVMIEEAPDFFYLKAEKETDRALPPLRVYAYNRGWQGTTGTEQKMFLITDRSAYRPGQTVYVKGVCFEQQKHQAEVKSGRKVELVLMDAARKEIASKQVETNEFGSFTAEFTLPDACMNGVFALRAGRKTVRLVVEDYKRPTFEVILHAPERAYSLGDTVEVVANAHSLADVPMQGCRMEYVVRRTRYGWWRTDFTNGEVVAHGEATLDAEGNGVVRVPMNGDGNQGHWGDFFLFEVKVSVTNQAGETQEERIFLEAGTAPLQVEVEGVNERICRDKPIEVIFAVNNIGRQPVDAKVRYDWYACADGDHEAARKGESLAGGVVASNVPSAMEALQALPSGRYLLVVSADDGLGHIGKVEQEYVLFALDDKRPPVETPLWVYVENDSFDAQHPAVFYIGTSCREAYVIRNVGNLQQTFSKDVCRWMTDTIERVEVPYEERYGDGVTYHYCFVMNGKMHQASVALKRIVPQHNLVLNWKTFRDRMKPGQNEEWTLTVTHEDGTPAEAEMLALLYDASLDRIAMPHYDFFWQYTPLMVNFNWMESNAWSGFSAFFQQKEHYYTGWDFDVFSLWNFSGADCVQLKSTANGMYCRSMGCSTPESSPAPESNRAMRGASEDVAFEEEEMESRVLDAPNEDLRTKLQETAFFYPFLRTDAEGRVSIRFTLPQSLTTWRFRGFAHTQQMFTGMLTGDCVASKEFMLKPNMPRFVRRGDRTGVEATLANLTGKRMEGKAVLTLFDPITEEVIERQTKRFAVEANEAVPVAFEFEVDGDRQLLGCRIEAGNAAFSDGEQHLITVLPDRVHLVETELLPIRGGEEKRVDIAHLFNGHSKTADDRKLTVELTANPNWYAVLALPGLVEPQRKDALSWCAAYYASALAASIVEGNPAIRRVVEAWKQSNPGETLQSNLLRNKELKEMILAEMPWLLEAENETEQMNRMMMLFDQNRVRNSLLTALTQLKSLQHTDGSWAWYPGMPGNTYVTTYVMTLLARQTALTAQPLEGIAADMMRSGWAYLDKELKEVYRNVRSLERENKSAYVPSFAMDYLYLAAVAQRSVPKEVKSASTYFLDKMEQGLRGSGMSDKARAAVILKHAGRNRKAAEVMASLREHLMQTDERGMYFAFLEHPSRWNECRISAHVQVMEAFQMVDPDPYVIDEMRIWLLKQKQVSSWSNTVTTADAVYALLMGNAHLDGKPAELHLAIGNQRIDASQSKVPGLGYCKETFTSKDVLKAQQITLSKPGEGIAWGAVYARYTEDIARVNEQSTGIGVKKEMYLERMDDGHRTLTPLAEGQMLNVGDKVVVRIVLSTDRPMEFVELKDMRASCMEPVQQRSGTMWNGSLIYYVDLKDAATCYFFDSLAKGVYTLESAYRIDRRGVYQDGMATMQCVYAPEFTAHSDAKKIEVK